MTLSTERVRSTLIARDTLFGEQNFVLRTIPGVPQLLFDP